MNRLGVSAFAAVVLAGRPRLFLLWLGLDLFVFLATVLPVQSHDAGMWYALLSYSSGAVIMLAINVAIDRSSCGAFALAEALEAERRKNEELVYNMLPPAAVERIRDGRMVADAYADASVIFIDMVGFTKLAKRVSPGHLVEVLNAFFNHADACAAKHGVEKVKTIGDAYLAIAGGNVTSGNSADSAIAFARDVLAGVAELQAVAGTDVGLRVGINRTWDSRWFAGSDYAKLLHADVKLREALKERLKGAGVAKVVIERPAKKPRVTIHAARPGVVIGEPGRDGLVQRRGAQGQRRQDQDEGQDDAHAATSSGTQPHGCSQTRSSR